MKVTTAIAIFLGWTLVSCSTTQSTSKPEITAQKPTELVLANNATPLKPNVTLVRYNALPILLTSRMKVNGEEVARLKNKQYAKIHLPPGQHELKVAYAPLSLQSGTSEKIIIKAGENYVFEVKSTSSSGVVNGYGNANIGISINEYTLDNFNINLRQCCEDVSR